MPFLEVLASGNRPGARARAAQSMTKSLADAYEISPSIISTYFVELPEDGYAHAGASQETIELRRIFLKVHAYPRPPEKRRVAAEGLTTALADAFGVSPDLIAVYFFDRDPAEVAHGGKMATA